MIKLARTFLLILAVPLASLSYGEGDGMRGWQKYHFDGKEFREGAASAGGTVFRRDGHLPVIQTGDEVPQEEKLPAGTGGVVGLCYIQTAGGKVQSHGGFVSLAGAAVEIRNGERKMAIRTDGGGYAVLALPAGEYELRVQGFSRKIRIEKGKTSFAAIRAGKRMVD